MNQKTTENNTVEIDLGEIFRLLISKLWIILLTGFVFAAVTGCICKFMITPQYSSTAELAITGSSNTISSLTDLQIGTQLTQDYIVVVQSRPVVEKVIKNLNLNMTYKELLNKTSVTNPSDTRILNITVTNPDPYLAKQIVDQYALVSKTRIAQLLDIKEPGIVEAGHVASDQDSPATGKNVVIAAIIGCLLCAAVIIVRFIMDDTIKSSDDIEKYLGLTTLAVLPLEQSQLDEQDRERRENKQLEKAYRRRKKTQNKKGE